MNNIVVSFRPVIVLFTMFIISSNLKLADEFNNGIKVFLSILIVSSLVALSNFLRYSSKFTSVERISVASFSVSVPLKVVPFASIKMSNFCLVST